jgi:hypothetical protein
MNMIKDAFGNFTMLTTPDVGEALDLPTNTVRRVLEDLTVYRLVKRTHTPILRVRRFSPPASPHPQPMEAGMAKRHKETFKLRLAEADEAIRITPSLERQQWLELVVEALRTKFAGAGYTVPQKIRISIGWPKRSATCGAIDECWFNTPVAGWLAECQAKPSISKCPNPCAGFDLGSFG